MGKYFRIPVEGEVAVIDELLLRCDCCVWNKIYRREIIEQKQLRFPNGLRYEDEFFFACYTAHARRICLINEPLCSYRRHGESYTGCGVRKKTGRVKIMVAIANRIWEYHDKQGLLASRIGFVSYRWLQLCMQAYRNAADADELETIKKEAIAFARQYILPQEVLPAAARQRLNLLLEDKWENTTLKWGGLLRIVTKDKSTLTCCRMKTKYYLAGILLMVQQRIHPAIP